MKNQEIKQRLFVLFVLCIMNSQQILHLHAQKLEQNKDKVAVTTTPSIQTENQKSNDVVVKTYSAAEMCHKYSELIYTKLKNPILSLNPENKYIKVQNCITVTALILGGSKAESREFPHMALLGYNEIIDNVWHCGGSLISERWILTAAHCEKLDDRNPARWARLGDLNYLSDDDDDNARNYRIIQRKIHPNYRPPSLYNDIALFLLENDVELSPYLRPICLNTDHLFNSSTTIASGWGKIQQNGLSSSDLLKVQLDIIPTNQCNSSYTNYKKHLMNAIDDNTMICAGYLEGGKDTCQGDSGGPIQIKNTNYKCMFTQIGITSFGKGCGKINTPAVYTRVSAYIPWIEQIVWPKIE